MKISGYSSAPIGLVETQWPARKRPLRDPSNIGDGLLPAILTFVVKPSMEADVIERTAACKGVRSPLPREFA